MSYQPYQSADAWRKDAMLRPDGVNADGVANRRKKAQQFYAQEQETPDADVLADQELYIRGKMDMDEYQDYLLFKHSPSK